MIALGASPLAAQSFLQSLFGFGNKPAPAPHAAPYPGQPGVLYQGAPPFSPYQRPLRRDFQSQAEDDDNGGAGKPGRGRYRTMCVRLCDGFYFPISQATNRAGVSRDAERCAASCGTEARVFYGDDHDGTVDDMVDLTGRVYARLPNAFLYRKKLIDGCTCKPMPWSTAELARHDRYAAAEAEKAEREKNAIAAAAPAAKARSASAVQPTANMNAKPAAAARHAVPVIVGTPLKADEDLSSVMPAEEASGDAADGSGDGSSAVAEAAAPAASDTAAAGIAAATPAESRVDAELVSSKQKRAYRPQPAAAPRVTRAAAPAQPTAGLFGGGASKYVWPGDTPPPRYR